MRKVVHFCEVVALRLFIIEIKVTNGNADVYTEAESKKGDLLKDGLVVLQVVWVRR